MQSEIEVLLETEDPSSGSTVGEQHQLYIRQAATGHWGPWHSFEEAYVSVTRINDHPSSCQCVVDALGMFSENHLTYVFRSEEHTSELQSRENLVCRLLLEKKKKKHI